MTTSKHILSLCACLLVFVINTLAQTEVRYYKDENLWKETTQKKAKFISTITTEGDIVTNIVTYPDGKLCFTESYKGNEPVGIWKMKTGAELNYNFELRYESQGEKYKAPKAEQIEPAKDTTERKEDREHYIETFPIHNGGEAGMMQFISRNVRYPRKAIDLNLSGVVYLTFVVERDGTVSDVYSAKAVHPLLDKEAQRVAQMIRFDKPAYQGGKAVRMSYVLPVKFQLK